MLSKILNEKQLHSLLDKYYKKHYGERDTDEWYVNPAVNVWLFIRDDKLITLKCHMLTGEITKKEEPFKK